MSKATFVKRRAQLLQQMQAQGGGVAIIATAHEMTRNNDNTFPFRHDSYFYYLSGFTEPEALIVLIADGTSQRSILFCREKDLEHEIWDGFRYGPTAAQAHFGFDAAFAIEAVDDMVGQRLQLGVPVVGRKVLEMAKPDEARRNPGHHRRGLDFLSSHRRGRPGHRQRTGGRN